MATLWALLLGGCYATNSSDLLRPGDRSEIQATVTSTCAGCAEQADMTISWVESGDPVDGYRIYYGPTPDTASELLGGGAPDNIATIPLYLEPDQQICIRVKSYVGDLESDFSSAVCVEAF